MGGTVGKDLLMILGIFILFFLGWVFLGGPSGAFEGGSRSAGFGGGFGFVPRVGGLGFSEETLSQGEDNEQLPQEENPIVPPEDVSPWAGTVRLSQGNARSESDPNEEYVIIAISNSQDSVNLTGWSLGNNRRGDFVRTDNNAINRANSEQVTIGQGARIVANNGQSTLGPIVLEPKGKAYVITGESPDRFPVLLNTSFLETKCTYYFNQTERFKPIMSGSCPIPRDEPGAENMSNQCFQFIRGLNACQTPTRDRMTELSNQCRTYIEDHFDYQGCVRYHKNDEDFFTKKWRVYLDFPRELWAQGRDMIILYDENGLIVDLINYN